MNLAKRFGSLLAAQRKRLSLTQDQLADLAGISVDMISRLETGNTGASFATIEKLANGLGVDPAVFFAAGPSSSKDMRPDLHDVTAKLAKLSDSDLAWITNLLTAALIDKPGRVRVTTRSVAGRAAKSKND